MSATADVLAFGKVKRLGITLRVPVGVSEVEMKPHKTLGMQLSPSNV